MPQLSTGWFHGPRHSFQRGGSTGPATAFNGVVPRGPPQLSTGWFHGARHSFQRGGSTGPPQLSTGWFHGPRHSFQRGGSAGPGTGVSGFPGCGGGRFRRHPPQPGQAACGGLHTLPHGPSSLSPQYAKISHLT
ncbi:hypothetical protein Ddc_16528 [Ditylenchus destructor]|nr:hypothetical protein Ddc_16528 [Ditylenchus destructor]